MALSKTFKPTSEGTAVQFLGFDLEGKPKPYMLRVKTAAFAADLVTAMQKEVEDIKE